MKFIAGSFLAFFSVTAFAETLTVQVFTDAGNHQAVVNVPVGGEVSPFNLEFQNQKYKSITVEFNARAFDESLIIYKGVIRAETLPEYRVEKGVKLPSTRVYTSGFSGLIGEKSSQDVGGYSQWEAEKNQTTNEVRVTFSR